MAMSIQRQSEEVENLLARLGSGQNPRRILTIDEVAEGLTACYLNGLGLLEDTRLLATNRQEPRALSLAILALEELAKIPDLADLFTNPTTGSNAQAWTDFWKRFSQHKLKQKRIAAYGNILRDATNLEKVALANPAPYANFLSENTYGHLDNVKHRNFYVDFIGDQFRQPKSGNDISTALDSLFSFAEERADSFGSWHITKQRSVDFLAVRLSLLSSTTAEFSDTFSRLQSLNDWASSHSAVEADADLLRLLCYSSSAMVPNYDSFFSECESFLLKKSEPERNNMLGRAVASLKLRMSIEALPKTRHRAFLMFKLLFSYSTRCLSDGECKRIFGVSLTEDAKKHFRRRR